MTVLASLTVNTIDVCNCLCTCHIGHHLNWAPLPTTATTMKGLLVCLLLPVGLAQAIRVYLSPPSSLPSKLSAKQASFALSRHLDLESFETPDEDSLVWKGPLHQEFVGQGPKDGLLLSIDESHVSGTFSRLPNGFTRVPADLTSLGVQTSFRSWIRPSRSL